MTRRADKLARARETHAGAWEEFDAALWGGCGGRWEAAEAFGGCAHLFPCPFFLTGVRVGGAEARL